MKVIEKGIDDHLNPKNPEEGGANEEDDGYDHPSELCKTIHTKAKLHKMEQNSKEYAGKIVNLNKYSMKMYLYTEIIRNFVAISG